MVDRLFIDLARGMQPWTMLMSPIMTHAVSVIGSQQRETGEIGTKIMKVRLTIMLVGELSIRHPLCLDRRR